MVLRTIFKFFLRIICGFIAFVVLYLVFEFSLSRIPSQREPVNAADVSIYIVTDGIHTDIAVPIKNKQMDWSREIKFQYTTSLDTAWQYVAMGWGDKAFYLETPGWADLKIGVALRAGFGLSASAIHTVFCNALTETKNCKRIYLSAAQYQRLIPYLLGSFKTDAKGHFINIKTSSNYGPADAFYEANRHYSIFYTCNTWANNALKSCGQKACLWTVFYNGIFEQYR